MSQDQQNAGPAVDDEVVFVGILGVPLDGFQARPQAVPQSRFVNNGKYAHLIRTVHAAWGVDLTNFWGLEYLDPQLDVLEDKIKTEKGPVAVSRLQFHVPGTNETFSARSFSDGQGGAQLFIGDIVKKGDKQQPWSPAKAQAIVAMARGAGLKSLELSGSAAQKADLWLATMLENIEAMKAGDGFIPVTNYAPLAGSASYQALSAALMDPAMDPQVRAQFMNHFDPHGKGPLAQMLGGQAAPAQPTAPVAAPEAPAAAEPAAPAAAPSALEEWRGAWAEIGQRTLSLIYPAPEQAGVELLQQADSKADVLAFLHEIKEKNPGFSPTKADMKGLIEDMKKDGAPDLLVEFMDKMIRADAAGKLPEKYDRIVDGFCRKQLAREGRLDNDQQDQPAADAGPIGLVERLKYAYAGIKQAFTEDVAEDKGFFDRLKTAAANVKTALTEQDPNAEPKEPGFLARIAGKVKSMFSSAPASVSPQATAAPSAPVLDEVGSAPQAPAAAEISSASLAAASAPAPALRAPALIVLDEDTPAQASSAIDASKFVAKSSVQEEQAKPVPPPAVSSRAMNKPPSTRLG